MDTRRLDTAAVVASGILGRPAPVTDIPQDRARVDGSNDAGAYIGDDAVEAAIVEGKVVSASNYYGIPYLWKQADGVYCGRLLQYRAVTESATFDSPSAAAEWFGETFHATDG